MEISKAKATDIESIAKIYERIHDAEENGAVTTGWIRNVYPTEKTARDALKRDDLFVMRDNGKITAAAVINQVQGEEYKDAAWAHDADRCEVMVLHCLAVDPFEHNKGYGKMFVSFYENYAREHGCSELRMDTNVLNLRAQKLYNKLGYTNVGVVKCVFNGIPDVRLICLEKFLG